MCANVSAYSRASSSSSLVRGMEPLLPPEPPVRVGRERESSLEGDLASSGRNTSALRAGNPGDFDRDRSPVRRWGVVHSLKEDVRQSSRRATQGPHGASRSTGMTNEEARAECRFKPNNKLQGVSDQVRFKWLTMRQSPRKKCSTPSASVSASSCISSIPALSVLGVEAYCVILAHRGAARRFLKILKF